MAGRKENLKSLFTNTRSRVIIMFTAGILTVSILVGIFKFTSILKPTDNNDGSLTNAPSIESIPGVLNPTAQYASLQEEQNVQQAKKALQLGSSAIPTIIKTKAFGDGAAPILPDSGKGSIGFDTLSRENDGGPQKSLWIQSLKDAQCSKDSINSVVSQGGALSDLRGACSCKELKDNGYSLSNLKVVCSCPDLKSAGFSAKALKNQGYSASSLKDCGYNACQMKAAGFSAQDLKNAGFADDELKGAGFDAADINKASGIPAGMTLDDIKKAGCQLNSLIKLKAAGVSAAAIRRINGCSPEALRAAGYDAKELKDAGFTAAQLLKAGFTPKDLKKAGYTAHDLLNAGLDPNDLIKAGFTPDEIRSAENILPPGVTPDEIKAQGCDPSALKRERLAGVSALLIERYAKCSVDSLHKAGFSPNALSDAGFSKEDIAAALAKDNALKASNPISDKEAAEIKAAGCDVSALKKLQSENVSAKEIEKLNHCSLQNLKAAGYDAKDLANAGFTPGQLLDAGFTPEDLLHAGLSPSAVIAAGRVDDCSVKSLETAHALNVSVKTIKETLGCDAEALKAAGYDPKDLKDAGFTAGELKDAGVSPKDLLQAGFTPSELRAAGFTPAELMKAGLNVKALHNAGFTPQELKKAGLSDTALRLAGVLEPQKVEPLATINKDNTSPISNPLQSELSIAPVTSGNQEAANTKQLQDILKKQQDQMAAQRYQQQIQQKTANMASAATQSLQNWKTIASQVYIAGSHKDESSALSRASNSQNANGSQGNFDLSNSGVMSGNQQPIVKAGDVLFAVLDTSVNSDEPGPILATIVSDKLKGAKLIGTFNLPTNADKMVISFNTLSVPGATKTTSISAYAIDPNTARTALASETDHHYLLRYGSLFAATFLEGFGNAFQSANTTVTVGGTGGVTNTTIESGVGRSTLENAVIGLATLGKAWGQVAQQQFNTPTTVDVYSGTGLGILFTQDLASF